MKRVSIRELTVARIEIEKAVLEQGNTGSSWPEVIFKYGWKIADKVRLVYLFGGYGSDGITGDIIKKNSGRIADGCLHAYLIGADRTEILSSTDVGFFASTFFCPPETAAPGVKRALDAAAGPGSG
jgi:hypothetical protein